MTTVKVVGFAVIGMILSAIVIVTATTVEIFILSTVFFCLSATVLIMALLLKVAKWVQSETFRLF